jgi:hypothetical protein
MLCQRESVEFACDINAKIGCCYITKQSLVIYCDIVTI